MGGPSHGVPGRRSRNRSRRGSNLLASAAVTVSVPIPGPLRPAVLVERPNRFLLRARTELEHESLDVFLPDPAPLPDLVVPGARLWIREAPPSASASGNPRPRWTATLIASPAGTLVTLDRSLPAALVAAAVRAGELEELAGFDVEAEGVPRGPIRLDLRLRDVAGNRVWVQVESVVGARDGRGVFPDSPSERATRSLTQLTEVAAQPGEGAALVLVAPRSDVAEIHPGPDPDFAAALTRAARGGVRIVGRRCQPTLEELVLGLAVPVRARG
jgi:DNA-binding sugar fermentation-stimulating protein